MIVNRFSLFFFVFSYFVLVNISDTLQSNISHILSIVSIGMCLALLLHISLILDARIPVFSASSLWFISCSANKTFNLHLINSNSPYIIKGCQTDRPCTLFICYYLILLFDLVQFCKINAGNLQEYF